jgi:hypothetical protein
VPEDSRDYEDLAPHSPEVAAYLQRQQKTLEAIRRAADTPGCRYDFDYSKPDFDAIAAIGRSRRPLRIAATVEAAAGNVDLALADCQRLYLMSTHAASSPMSLSSMVAISIDTSASRAMAKVLPYVTSHVQLQHFSAPDPREVQRRCVRCLRGEEAVGLAYFCSMIRPGGAVMWLTWMRDDVENYRSDMQRVRQLVQHPYWEVAAELEQMKQADGAKREQEDGAGGGRGFLSRHVPLILHSQVLSMVRAQALRTAVDVACATTHYRLDHAEYPPTAAALVPDYLDAVPADPFDGQPMRLKKNADGSLAIYSVGPDGVDHGGQVEVPPGSLPGARPADLGFILKLPQGH